MSMAVSIGVSVLGIVCVVALGFIALYHVFCRAKEQEEMTRYIDRLEDSLKEQFEFSKRTLDTSSLIMMSALHITDQRQGSGNIVPEDRGETED